MFIAPQYHHILCSSGLDCKAGPVAVDI